MSQSHDFPKIFLFVQICAYKRARVCFETGIPPVSKQTLGAGTGKHSAAPVEEAGGRLGKTAEWAGNGGSLSQGAARACAGVLCALVWRREELLFLHIVRIDRYVKRGHTVSST